ncbi:FadR family transcriptional regulator [Mycobacterium sp. WUMAC-067]|uniref:FadR/GntR family transcriptional regulator n=1 Tax=unclassified Mycobacterium TaxID=2642494 RepID=UPI001CDA4DE6|nr:MULTISPECIES: FadR/GntR family transcriptional regulator [unclassified Mycobacterium]MCA2243762.1 FadR family transcriptional regulator [Mycobacterium sp. WUMAC-067]MCA2315138.1 FadR family transcriptional regulator [Mycobacterium sp. WUMAC-025]
MALQPVIRRSVPEAVFDQIATDVLSGEMRPGAALPSERRLAEVFGVSRPAVREALKRLSAASLVEVRQGGVTTVRDFRRHAGLDLLPQLLFRNGELDPVVFRSILEARLRIGPKVAELAAEQHGPELVALLEDSLAGLEVRADLVEWQLDTLAFWDHLVDSSGSIVFRLMYNAFRAAYERALAALATAMTPEVNRADAYRKLAGAICGGDAAAARKAAHDVLELANATMTAALDRRGEPR